MSTAQVGTREPLCGVQSLHPPVHSVRDQIQLPDLACATSALPLSHLAGPVLGFLKQFHTVAQAGPELEAILLPQPPKCYHYRCEPV